METLLQNTLTGSLLIGSLGYLIYRLGDKVKSFSNKSIPDCHDEQEKEDCDNCLLAPKNRSAVTSLQRTL